MKFNLLKTILLFLLIGMSAETLHAQGRLIRKIQQRAEDKAVDKIFGDSDKKDDPETKRYEDEASEPTRHRKGGGLEKDIPDVNQNILDAESAYEARKFAEAKAAIRQALWGVELGIGQNILNSLPKTVEGLNADTDEDRVSSTGIGFVGLVIERMYKGSNDMELKASIGNDAALLGLAGVYMASGMYVNTTDDTDQKQIRYQEHRGIITYDDYEGYTLSVSFGQSSVFVVRGTNFETEGQFMAAANTFDINTIKKELGEQ